MPRRAPNRERDQVEGLRGRLFTILRDVVIDLGRDRTTGPRVGGIEATVERLEQSLRGWQVEEAMRRLDPLYRQVLVETYYRGRSYVEIATELSIPERAVRGRLSVPRHAVRTTSRCRWALETSSARLAAFPRAYPRTSAFGLK